ncbi:MAG: LacI family DNA-binding transcriptional regulator [Candidatus Sumerlaeota bacterium]|nr:LacI family DNA-binding transcriptional regulator [Candidatus Sumerlaeota bacterium]
MSRKTVTLKDVACHAGVSVATTSQALLGYQTVASATRERVKQSARALGYRPSPVGRALVGAKTFTIGIVVGSLEGEGTMAGLRSLTSEIRRHGYAPLIMMVGENERDRLSGLDDLAGYGVDGLIVTESMVRLSAVRDRIQELAAGGLPVVGRGAGFAKVGIDCVADLGLAGQRAVFRRLVELGHRRIGLVCLSRNDGRAAGYRREMRAAGLDTDERLILDYRLNADIRRIRETFMALDVPPTAIVAPWDSVAAALIDDLDRAGYRVPADVSVAGAGGDWYSAYLRVGLTTLRIDWEGANRACVEMLMERIVDPSLPPRTRHFEARLIERESTAPPRANSVSSGAPFARDAVWPARKGKAK